MPSRRPLLLGEMPSAAGDKFWRFPLSGAPAARLSIWAGLEREGDEAWFWTLTRVYDTMNAQLRHAEVFDLKAAQERWTHYLLNEVPERQKLTVVCLGVNAARTIGAGLHSWESRAGKPWGEWQEVGLLQYTAIPHPSGRNRLYNDKEMKLTAQRVLREAVELAENDDALVVDGRVRGLIR